MSDDKIQRNIIKMLYGPHRRPKKDPLPIDMASSSSSEPSPERSDPDVEKLQMAPRLVDVLALDCGKVGEMGDQLEHLITAETNRSDCPLEFCRLFDPTCLRMDQWIVKWGCIITLSNNILIANEIETGKQISLPTENGLVYIGDLIWDVQIKDHMMTSISGYRFENHAFEKVITVDTKSNMVSWGYRLSEERVAIVQPIVTCDQKAIRCSESAPRWGHGGDWGSLQEYVP